MESILMTGCSLANQLLNFCQLVYFYGFILYLPNIFIGLNSMMFSIFYTISRASFFCPILLVMITY